MPMPPESDTENSDENTRASGGALPFIAGLILIAGILVLLKRGDQSGNPRPPQSAEDYQTSAPAGTEATKKYSGNYITHGGFTNLFDKDTEVTFWWSEVARELSGAAIDTGTNSNIRMADYTGHTACAECHQDKHDDWAGHAHRWMNATAIPEHIVGDFSGQAAIEYQGGVGTFYREGERYRMKLVRGEVERVYDINRTIGSRFFQYYTGRLIAGAETEPDPLRQTEHVLPFGYWIDSKEWIPTVHVYRDTDYYDDARDVYTDNEIAPYDTGCSICHITRANGDWLAALSGGKRMSAYSSHSTAFDVVGYLAEEHPDLVGSKSVGDSLSPDEQKYIMEEVFAQPFAEHGVDHGISCEACHLGGRAHIAASTKTETRQAPFFFPVSEHLHTPGKDLATVAQRTDGNANLICSRCHSGGRKPYANGIHTWNSTEFADGVRGTCYSRKTGSHPDTPTLTCITCHDPHQGIGAQWKMTDQQNSEKCVTCHQQFRSAAAVEAHTHHTTGSGGSQCMNCHNPKITEGLQKMTHTHHTFSPTDPKMIEANQPNACNMCHLDKPIDWTIRHLQDWYGEEHKYSERALLQNYPNRSGPVGEGWLLSPHHPTRLVAAESLVANHLTEALPRLLNLLVDDSNIINRQFTQKRLDESLGIRLKDMGYQFYHPEKRRKQTMVKLRPELLKLAPPR